MKIKKASASFGKLNGDTLELKNGLNIIKAPNESGKSTWCAFIRTMLFGLNTADRDKAGYLSDKTKYRPWNDKPMEGSMDITHDGQDITIQRTTLGRAPMKDFSAVITGTDIEIKGLSGENAGTVLTGVTKPVFERSAFIRQSGIQISQTGELEKRIASIVSSGDEAVSYTEADKKLRAWTRRRKYNSSGTIPTIQAKIKENLDALDSIRAESSETARLRAERDRLSAEVQLLENELTAHAALEELENRRQLEKLKIDVSQKEADVRRLEAELERYGATDEDILNELRSDIAASHSFSDMKNTAEANLHEAQHAFESTKTAADASPLGKLTVGQADDACDNAEQLEASCEKSRKRAVTVSVIFAVLAVLTAAAGFFIKVPVSFALWAAALVCIVIIICVNASKTKAKRRLSDALTALHAEDTASLRKTFREYSELRAYEETCRAALAAAENMYDSAVQTCQNHKDSMLKNAAKVIPDIEDTDVIPKELSRIAELKKELALANSAYDMANMLYETRVTDHPVKEVEMPAITPRYEKSRTQAALNDTKRRLENTNAAYNMTLGRMRALGDPMILEGEIRTLREKLDEQTAQYEALTLATEVLAEADNEIHTRFAPVLAKTAGTIFNRVTGGKYDMLAFDKTLDAAAQAKGDTVSKNVLYLSEGTADQIYFSLRLAVCLLALPGDDPCPIILDDAFASFDDTRLELALDYLKELSETHQIILFSCHSREAEHFVNDPDVNIISL